MKKGSLKMYLIVILLIGAGMTGISMLSGMVTDKADLKAAEIRTREEEDRTQAESPVEGSDRKGIEETEEEIGQVDEETVKESSNLLDRLLIIDGQGEVEVGVTLENPLQDDEAYLVFKTQLNTHSVEVDGYDFGKLASLKTSDGILSTDRILWEKSGGDSHHFVGYYKVPRIIEGKKVVTEDTAYLELQLTGIDNVENRTFRWEKDVLDLIPIT